MANPTLSSPARTAAVAISATLSILSLPSEPMRESSTTPRSVVVVEVDGAGEGAAEEEADSVVGAFRSGWACVKAR